MEQFKFRRRISVVVVKVIQLHVRSNTFLQDQKLIQEILHFSIKKGLVLHGTAGGGTVSWFQNSASQVSAHYVVEQDGRIVQMVSEDDTAWHNGKLHVSYIG